MLSAHDESQLEMLEQLDQKLQQAETESLQLKQQCLMLSRAN